MFGLLDIKTCSLKKETKQYYACNVCNSISSNYGRSSRFLLSNDAVYLSLLIASQKPNLPVFSKLEKTCKPWSRKSLSLPEFEFPAAVSLFENGIKLSDDIIDEKSYQSKTMYLFYKKKIEQAEKNLRNFGVNIPSLNDIIKNQNERESNYGKKIDYYSKLTEDIYSSVFSKTAILAKTPENIRYLESIGKDIGRISYFLDAYMDIEKDQKNGCFNVFLKNDNTLKNNIEKYSSNLSNILHDSLKRIEKNILKINLYRYTDTIRYIVTNGLKIRIQNIIEGKSLFFTRPQITLALVPLAFLVMQTNQAQCSLCGECEFGAGSLCSFGDASSSVSFSERIGASAAEGIVGAAVGAGGAIAVSGGLSATSGTSGTSSQNISAETSISQSNAVDFDSIPQSSPEVPPWGKGSGKLPPQTEEYWKKMRKKYFPSEAPSDFPILSEEETTIRFLENNPESYNEAREVFDKVLKKQQEKIKIDVKAEQVRIKRGISLKEEFLEIWNSRPKEFDEYFIKNKKEKILEIIKINIKMDRTYYSKASELEQQLSRSNNPEIREWVKKLQSIVRRNWRFVPRDGEGYKILGSADSKAYASTAGSRA
jgi:hypothetical protein